MRDLDDAAYVPGTWVAISAANGCLLVDLAAADPVVRRCWKLLSEDAGVDAVLDALAGGGVAATPPFALVVRADTGHRIVVRHPAAVTVHAAGGDQVDVEAAPGTSWHDRALVDVTLDAVSLWGATTDASVELPMGAGVTMASVVQLRPGTPAETPSRPTPFPRDAATIESPAVPVAIEPEPEPEPELPPVVSVADVAEPVEDGDSYDHLFGASVQRPLAPAPQTPQPPAAVSGQTAGWQTAAPIPTPTPPIDAPAPDPAPAPTAGPADGGLIQGVPWAQPDAPTVASPAVVDSPVIETPVIDTPVADTPAAAAATVTIDAAGDDDAGYGATVNRAQLRAEASAAAAAAIGPTVLAGRCPNGHLSPPHADRCRVCRATMPPQEAVEIARPVLGSLRLQSGDVVTLDRGVLLGRSPDVPSGIDRPHVLRLKSPDNDISRNHSEIVLDGWNVYLRDLGSTNGTVVELPGRAPVRLRDNELTLLEHGAKITLAEEVTLVFEVQA